jgi:serine/threonine-protein kinase
MVDWLGKKSWAQAREALERAKGRLGDGDQAGPALRGSLERGRRDLDMVAQLDVIRARVAADARDRAGESVDESYAKAFLAYGLGRTSEGAEVVAARIRASDIRGAFVDALDVWPVSLGSNNPERKAWLLRVARLADRNQSDWVALARAPQARRERKSLYRLCESAPVDAEVVPLCLAVAADLARLGGDPIPLVSRVQESHPGDYWANLYLAIDMLAADRSAEAVRFAQAAVAIRPDYSIGYGTLGRALRQAGRVTEALRAYRTYSRLDPASTIAQCNYGMALTSDGRVEEAIAFFKEALRRAPQAEALHYGLGDALAFMNRHEEALAEFRRSLTLDSSPSQGRIRVEASEREMLFRLGRRDEARAAWASHIEANPQYPEIRDGYVEYCAFLGSDEDYRRARREILDRFAGAFEFRVAERFGRACLLLPGTPEETRQATELVDRAIADAKTTRRMEFHSYFMFAKGLAEYRLDRFDSALAIMQRDAAGVLGPAPQLVAAMALSRLGRREEARKAYALALGRFDWQEAKADNRDAWIYHVLRREAEELIGPSKAGKDE